MYKLIKDKLEFGIAIIGLLGVVFDYLHYKTFIILLLSSFGLFILTSKKIWIYERVDNKSFSTDAIKIKQILTYIFMLISITIISFNVVKHHLPKEINHFVSYHFLEPKELIELKTEKLIESEFKIYKNTENKILKNAIKNPQILIKGSDKDYISFSFLFLTTESMQYLYNTTFQLLFWSVLILLILIFGMFIADRVNGKFTSKNI